MCIRCFVMVVRVAMMGVRVRIFVIAMAMVVRLRDRKYTGAVKKLKAVKEPVVCCRGQVFVYYLISNEKAVGSEEVVSFGDGLVTRFEVSACAGFVSQV